MTQARNAVDGLKNDTGSKLFRLIEKKEQVDFKIKMVEASVTDLKMAIQSDREELQKLQELHEMPHKDPELPVLDFGAGAAGGGRLERLHPVLDSE